jgi:Glutathione S-transferase, N-terminal domain
MYTLITANRNYSSWSLRPWMLMKGLGITFEDRLEPFTAPSNFDEFRVFSPTGQVPVLLHEGRTIHDSMGITLYLADRHEGVWPVDPDARAWAQCAAAEMHSGFSALRNDSRPMSRASESFGKKVCRTSAGLFWPVRISAPSTPSSRLSHTVRALTVLTSARVRPGSTISSLTRRCSNGRLRRWLKAGAKWGMKRSF